MLGSLSQGFCLWALWFSHCKRFALANCDNFFVTGGTFALYSLLCRHAKLSLILNQQTADVELSTYKLEQPPETPRGLWVRKLLEKYEILRHGLLIIVLLGTCMVIGDGVLTPAISGKRSPTDGFWNCCWFFPKSLHLSVNEYCRFAECRNLLEFPCTSA